MKPTLLFATLSLALASPSAFAKTELEILRARCAEQEAQIRKLENDQRGNPAPAGKTETAAAAKTAAAPAPSASTYTVKAGDNLEKIARKVGANPQKLAKTNGLKTNSIIHPGQKLKVPGASAPSQAPASAVAAASSPAPQNSGKTHKVLAGETFSSISRKYGTSAQALVSANPKVKPSALRPGQVINLGRTSTPAPAPSSTTMISTSRATAPEEKAPAPVEKAAAPAPTPAAKAPVTHQNIPISTPIPVSKPAPTASTPAAMPPETKPAPAIAASQPVAEKAPAKESSSPTAEKKIRPVTIEGEMTYGEFASKHGTDAERLNALNGLDLTTATVLAKGSELYVPAQP